MAVSLVRTKYNVSALYQGQLQFGPWPFERTRPFDLFLGVAIQIEATTLAQIIGGVSPSIAAISTAQFIILQPDQHIKVGLHGVNAQTDGFAQAADGVLILDDVTITSLSLYNTTALTAVVFLGVGGSA